MILLLGGTSETKAIALEIAFRGQEVLVSTATDNELEIGNHPNISRRIGRMTEDEMAALITDKRIAAVVDASHPFAVVAHETARNAAVRCGVPCLRYERKRADYGYEVVEWAQSHEEAAAMAFSHGRPVLLTTGSRNLAPYVRQARSRGTPVVARVLLHPESEEACARAGLMPHEVILGRGPFSVEENLETIRARGIGTVVTKDSGEAGGVAEKVEAARMAGCRVVIIERPPESSRISFGTAQGIADALESATQRR